MGDKLHNFRLSPILNYTNKIQHPPLFPPSRLIYCSSLRMRIQFCTVVRDLPLFIINFLVVILGSSVIKSNMIFTVFNWPFGSLLAHFFGSLS